MYHAVLNVPNLNVVLRLNQLGGENYDVRCLFKKDSKGLESAASGKVTPSKRQPLIEKNEKLAQPVKPGQSEKLQQNEQGYNLRTLNQVEVMGLAGDNPKVFLGLANIQAKEKHTVFFIGDMPFGLQIDADKAEKQGRGRVLFLCFQCGKTLCETKSMLAHGYGHIGLKQFPCPLCEKAYSYRAGLNRHCKKHHRPVVSSPAKNKPNLRAEHFTCPICQKGYEVKNSFYRHWRLEHKNSERLPPIVTRAVGTSPASVAQIVEEVPPPATCSTCSKTFTNKRSLKTHFNTVHSTIHNYFCLHCYKGFYYKATYENHMKGELKRQRLQNTDKENIPPFDKFLRYIND